MLDAGSWILDSKTKFLFEYPSIEHPVSARFKQRDLTQATGRFEAELRYLTVGGIMPW